MAEPESWEDMEGAAPSAQPHRGLNPNAASFTFNPSAPSFTPSFDLHSGYSPPSVSVPPDSSAVASPVPVTATLCASSTPCVEHDFTSFPPTVAPLATDCGLPSHVVAEFGGSDSASDVETLGSLEENNLEYDQMDVGNVDAKGKKGISANGDVTDQTGNASSLASMKLTETEEMRVDEDQARVLYEDDRIEQEQELEEESEESQHLNVVFIGHVDAGKSTIGGQILYLTNMVDERTIQKYEREAKEKNRESWYMAYIMDTNEEERAKGKTVEVGRAHFEIDKKRFTILDAPGHKNYVPNMISGASQADIGVLVISARKGEFETGFERGGQTREHAQLAKTLGVSKLLVVVNKMDDPSVQWSKERFDDISKKIIPFLRSCGYNVKKDVQFLPISGLLGSNMKDRVLKSVCPWWDGQCLFELLTIIEPPPRDCNGPFRMPLIDRFKDMGTVVMGKIESGTVRRGDNLVMMPNKVNVKVVTVYRDANEVNLARPGENLRIRLSGVEEEDISPGFVLSSICRPISAVLEFDAQLQILELMDHKAIFTAGYKAVLHIHAIVEECEIIELLQQIDPKTKKPMKKKVLFVKSGAVVVVRLQVNEPICVERFEDFPQLGRFTLRDEGKTVAIGKVVSLPAASNSE